MPKTIQNKSNDTKEEPNKTNKVNKIYYVTLENCGNVDFGQDPDKPIYGSVNKLAKCETISECKTACSDYIKFYDLGGGNWIGGDVYPNAECNPSELIGSFSYNGRFWDKKGNEILNLETGAERIRMKTEEIDKYKNIDKTKLNYAKLIYQIQQPIKKYITLASGGDNKTIKKLAGLDLPEGETAAIKYIYDHMLYHKGGISSDLLRTLDYWGDALFKIFEIYLDITTEKSYVKSYKNFLSNTNIKKEAITAYNLHKSLIILKYLITNNYGLPESSNTKQLTTKWIK